MITIEMINAALAGLAGLVVLGLTLTQIFKNLFNKENKRGISHLISWCVSLVLNGAVLLCGIFAHFGFYTDFIVSDWHYWVMFAGNVVAVALCSNGTWSYDIAKKFLEWLKLLPISKVTDIFETDRK